MVTTEEVARVAQALQDAVAAAGSLGLDVAGLDERQRAVLSSLDQLEVQGGRVRAVAAKDTLADHPALEAARRGGFAPPTPEGVDRATLRELVRRGLLIEREGVYFHRDAIEQARQVAVQLLKTFPDGFTVAQFRDTTGTSRKYVLPLVGELDARGITRRRDELRIAGPRIAG